MFKVQRSKVRHGGDTPTDLSSSAQPVCHTAAELRKTLFMWGGFQHDLALESLLENRLKLKELRGGSGWNQ